MLYGKGLSSHQTRLARRRSFTVPGTTATHLWGRHCGEQHHFPPEHALLSQLLPWGRQRLFATDFQTHAPGRASPSRVGSLLLMGTV